jgi:hypothetical protein
MQYSSWDQENVYVNRFLDDKQRLVISPLYKTKTTNVEDSLILKFCFVETTQEPLHLENLNLAQ